MRRIRPARRAGDGAWKGFLAATDHSLLSTLLVLAAAVLAWTLAVDPEIDWVAIAGLAAAMILLVLIWFRLGGQEPEDPPL